MALPDSLVTFCENAMARRWWTEDSKGTMDHYTAALLKIGLEAVTLTKDLKSHPKQFLGNDDVSMPDLLSKVMH